MGEGEATITYTASIFLKISRRCAFVLLFSANDAYITTPNVSCCLFVAFRRMIHAYLSISCCSMLAIRSLTFLVFFSHISSYCSPLQLNPLLVACCSFPLHMNQCDKDRVTAVTRRLPPRLCQKTPRCEKLSNIGHSVRGREAVPGPFEDVSSPLL